MITQLATAGEGGGWAWDTFWSTVGDGEDTGTHCLSPTPQLTTTNHQTSYHNKNHNTNIPMTTRRSK